MRLPQAISRLEKMDMSSLSQVCCAMATKGRKLAQSRGRVIGMVMKRMAVKQVIRLSGHFRRYTSMERSINWKEPDIREKRDWYRSDRNYFWVLALGNSHPKGYYRQVRLEGTAGRSNALPFFVFRLSDQVGQARLAATRAVLTRLEICPLGGLLMAMMALDKIERFGRKDGRAAGALPVFHGND